MKFGIIGNYGASNVGDELILEGLLATIRKSKPAAEIVVLSANPSHTREKFEVKSVHKFPAGPRSIFSYLLNGNFKKTKAQIKECDYVIVGGGGLFDDSSFKAIWIWTVQTYMAYSLKKKVIMYGQSIKEPRSSLTKKIIKKLFKKSSFVAVRDEDSKRIIKKLIRGKKVHLMPDLLFFLQPKFKQAKENKIILCLRDQPGKPQDFDKNLAKSKNYLIQKDEALQIDFLPFEKDSDERYHEQIIEKIAEKGRVQTRDFTEKRHKIEKLFSESKMVIGVRLHSVLMAINTETPFIAINYNPKVRNLLKTLGLSKFVIEPADATPENITQLYKTILEKEDQVVKKLKEVKEEQMRKHELTVSSLNKFIIN
ncbi:hypothetical protein HOC54_05660 [Candidatus Peregrinibacteria bacterium]|nr:hypothetical protein [Candidatus Peregrinibacteria bacterium]